MRPDTGIVIWGLLIIAFFWYTHAREIQKLADLNQELSSLRIMAECIREIDTDEGYAELGRAICSSLGQPEGCEFTSEEADKYLDEVYIPECIKRKQDERI